LRHLLETSLRIPQARDDVFRFFSDASNLERITPPRLRFRILSDVPIEMMVGTRIEYRLSLLRLPFRWTSEISEWQPPIRFVDRQLRGPYRSWQHTHEFSDDGDGTLMRDRVEYELPLWPLGEIARPLVGSELRRIFEFRSASIRNLLGADARAAHAHPGAASDARGGASS